MTERLATATVSLIRVTHGPTPGPRSGDDRGASSGWMRACGMEPPPAGDPAARHPADATATPVAAGCQPSARSRPGGGSAPGCAPWAAGLPLCWRLRCAAAVRRTPSPVRHVPTCRAGTRRTGVGLSALVPHGDGWSSVSVATMRNAHPVVARAQGAVVDPSFPGGRGWLSPTADISRSSPPASRQAEGGALTRTLPSHRCPRLDHAGRHADRDLSDAVRRDQLAQSLSRREPSTVETMPDVSPPAPRCSRGGTQGRAAPAPTVDSDGPGTRKNDRQTAATPM